jgi:hypothetical protein
MRKELLGSVLAVFVGGGVALCQDAPARLPSASEPGEAKSAAKSSASTSTATSEGASKTSETPVVVPAEPGAGIACCNEQRPCGPPGRYWASAEYLLWWTKPDRVPPLVTTGFAPGNGVLGLPDTVVLFGGDVDYGMRPGVRLTAGMWLDDCQTKGVEVSTFCLSDSNGVGFFSPGSPILARPFFDIATGAPGSELVAFPGLLAGGVDVDTESRLKSCEINATCNCKCCYTCDNCGCCQGGRLDVLAGFRFLELKEELNITENLVVQPGVPVLGTFPNIGGAPFVGGTQIGVRDHFRTENRFYGGQVGLRGEYAFGGGLFVNATGKVAVGVMQQTVDIEGATAVVGPGGTVVAPGGLLTQTTNIGHYERNEWATVSEVGVNVGYQVDRNFRVFVGYTLLYVTNVVRPGDVIDFTVNSTRVPTSLLPATGPARPAFTFRDSDFWAQGFSIGAEVRY